MWGDDKKSRMSRHKRVKTLAVEPAIWDWGGVIKAGRV